MNDDLGRVKSYCVFIDTDLTGCSVWYYCSTHRLGVDLLELCT